MCLVFYLTAFSCEHVWCFVTRHQRGVRAHVAKAKAGRRERAFRGRPMSFSLFSPSTRSSGSTVSDGKAASAQSSLAEPAFALSSPSCSSVQLRTPLAPEPVDWARLKEWDRLRQLLTSSSPAGTAQLQHQCGRLGRPDCTALLRRLRRALSGSGAHSAWCARQRR